MKKLAIFTVLIGSTALAHQTKFDQPDYLDMADGDPVAAQELSMFCSAMGKTPVDCKSTLSSDNGFKLDAARSCVQKMRSVAAKYHFPANDEAPGARNHQVNGSHWHLDYRIDADGVHRHAYSQDDRERAVSQYRSILIGRAAADQRDANGESTSSASKEVGKHADWGVDAGGKLGAGFSLKEGESQTKSKGLSKEILAKIEIDAKKAFAQPSLGEVKPSIVCFKNEKTCTISGGGTIPNETYEPSKEAKKEEEKKGADLTPPKHIDESVPDIEDNTTKGGGDVWAGSDTPRSTDDPIIATSVETDLSSKSSMEECLDNLYGEIMDALGSIDVDLKAAETDASRKETAEFMLALGSCDESYYGRAYCQEQKNISASATPLTFKKEQTEAYQQALVDFNMTGYCDPHALGCQQPVSKETGI